MKEAKVMLLDFRVSKYVSTDEVAIGQWRQCLYPFVKNDRSLLKDVNLSLRKNHNVGTAAKGRGRVQSGGCSYCGGSDEGVAAGVREQPETGEIDNVE